MSGGCCGFAGLRESGLMGASSICSCLWVMVCWLDSFGSFGFDGFAEVRSYQQGR